MTGALFEILLRSLRGRILRFKRQLSQPKYLVGFVVGGAWILFWMTSWTRNGNLKAVIFSGFSDRLGGGAELLLQYGFGLALAVMLSLGWLVPLGKLGLPFKESELHLLLPAPISRRKVIQFALLKAQGSLLITAFFFALVLGRGAGWQSLRLFVGIWVVFTLWELFGKWQALHMLRLKELPVPVGRGVRAVLGLSVIAFWIVVGRRIHTLGRAAFERAQEHADLQEVLMELALGLREGLAGALTAPFVRILSPLFVDGLREFLVALWLPAALLVLLHEVVVRSGARFEEAALQQARALDRRRSPVRRFLKLSLRARGSRPFPLGVTGRPEVAVVWKNLLYVSRIPLSRMLWWGGTALFAAAVIPALLDLRAFVFIIMLAIGQWTLVGAPMFVTLGVRADFRTELRHLESVRTWPIPGWRMVAAQITAPAIMGWLGSLVGAGLMLAGFFGSQLGMLLHQSGRTRVLPVDTMLILGLHPGWTLICLLAGFLPLAAAGALFLSALQNLGALLFPAWVGLGPQAARGMSAMGQRLLFAMGLGLGLAIGLIPGALLVGLAALAQWGAGLQWHAFALPVWGILAALPIVLETAVVVRLAGALWEELDPASEILESPS